ncbi:sensor histidine kinase family protein [Pengzhenrongella sicca]|uniref:histidine kinase n=1 Tax=Pengzhenrongella sicca TaxID=2819238 RepID=A0A8A4ZGA8_9MICO|nr:hypothetical protein [Pengzhenrongella sicca]QTE31062.1 hypothetical protein J4E96_09145 [Pengzhenrongella sicca]
MLHQLSALDRGPIVRKPVALDVVLEDALDDLQGEATERKINVRSDLCPAVVAGDPDLLLRVVDNLPRNSVRYNLPSDKWADVRLCTQSLPNRPGEIATLVVENSGTVIDAGQLALAMEPFTRDLGGSRTRERRTRAAHRLPPHTGSAFTSPHASSRRRRHDPPDPSP